MGCSVTKHKILFKEDTKLIYHNQVWSNREECCICLDNNSNILLLPCNHICVCQECTNIIINNKCPICRQNIYSYNLLIIKTIRSSN